MYEKLIPENIVTMFVQHARLFQQDMLILYTAGI
jgi:hypothetical protein